MILRLAVTVAVLAPHIPWQGVGCPAGFCVVSSQILPANPRSRRKQGLTPASQASWENKTSPHLSKPVGRSERSLCWQNASKSWETVTPFLTRRFARHWSAGHKPGFSSLWDVASPRPPAFPEAFASARRGCGSESRPVTRDRSNLCCLSEHFPRAGLRVCSHSATASEGRSPALLRGCHSPCLAAWPVAPGSTTVSVTGDRAQAPQ